MTRTRVLSLVIGALALLGLGGCRSGAATPPPLNVDLRTLIPQEWAPIGQLQPVNLDADPQVEYLLFYHYDPGRRPDGSAVPGPIGATIYDPVPPEILQNTELGPGAPAGGLQPYALLPSYWWGMGQGFLAPPTQTDAPVYYQVTRTNSEELTSSYIDELRKHLGSDTVPTAEQLPSHDELVVLGGQGTVGRWTHISVFWWHNYHVGYLGTQITAPGGLHILAWDGEPQISPIRRVQAFYPQNDRSALCKVSEFTRVLIESNSQTAPTPGKPALSPWRPAVHYVESPRMLRFCYGIPPTPFYPEGVVLAFLLEPDAHTDLVAPGKDVADQAASRQEKARHYLEVIGPYTWVEALYYPRATQENLWQAAQAAEVTTWVQAALAYLDPQAAGVSIRCTRWTLRHVPADLDKGTGDAWEITGVDVVPPGPDPNRPCYPAAGP